MNLFQKKSFYDNLLSKKNSLFLLLLCMLMISYISCAGLDFGLNVASAINKTKAVSNF
jgi:hypothetical protein